MLAPEETCQRATKPGVARRLVTFFASPKKVTKERRPQSRRPDDEPVGVPCATRERRRLRNSRLEDALSPGVAIGARRSNSPRRNPFARSVAQRLVWTRSKLLPTCPGAGRGPSCLGLSGVPTRSGLADLEMANAPHLGPI